MTREELKTILEDNQFSQLCTSNPSFASMIEGIYYDGMVEGYRLAIARLKMIGVGWDPAKEYRRKHEKQIKRIIDAVKEYEREHGAIED